MNYDKRGKEKTLEFIRTMRRRGHSRADVMQMIDEAEAELCPPVPEFEEYEAPELSQL